MATHKFMKYTLTLKERIMVVYAALFAEIVVGSPKTCLKCRKTTNYILFQILIILLLGSQGKKIVF